MDLLEFQETFVSEDDCIAYLIEQRWPDGYVCEGWVELSQVITADTGASSANTATGKRALPPIPCFTEAKHLSKSGF
jgi:hypothetical protein